MKNSKYVRPMLSGFLLYSLVFIRYLYYGFRYFYQLDDYIQYHNYTCFFDDLWGYIVDAGMLASRPAAGPADIFVWSRFYPCMIVAVALLSAMYTGAAFLLYRIFQNHFRVTPLFLVLFSLMPLGFEGTYWVSASSRVVCGLFFCVLGAWFLEKYWERKRWPYLLPAMLLELLGSCFYEQALVFGVALFILLGLLRAREQRFYALWSGISLVNTAIYFVLTSLMPSGLYESRMTWMLPNDPYYFRTFLPNILGQVKTVFLDGGSAVVWKGFTRGFGILVRDGAWLYLLLAVLLCTAFWWMFRREEERAGNKRLWMAVVLGMLLAASPITPFLFISNPWFCFRNAVFSFAGIALVVDVLVAALWNRFRIRSVAPALAAVVALVFVVCGVSELHDYKAVHEDDQKIADAIIARLDLSDPDQRIGLIGVEKCYLTEQNFDYHEHIHGVIESGWALNGLLQCKRKTRSTAKVIPLHSDCIYEYWNYEENRIDGFDLLYAYDYETNLFTPLQARGMPDGSFDLYTEDGVLFGRVEETDGRGYLTK